MTGGSATKILTSEYLFTHTKQKALNDLRVFCYPTENVDNNRINGELLVPVHDSEQISLRIYGRYL